MLDKTLGLCEGCGSPCRTAYCEVCAPPELRARFCWGSERDQLMASDRHRNGAPFENCGDLAIRVMHIRRPSASTAV